MALTEQGYQERLIDKKISRYLNVFGALSIEGAKWCGKTWTALNHAESVSFLTDKSTKDLATTDPKYIFTMNRPQLIDEWQVVPNVWDSVRHECDRSQEKGKFILTGSTTLNKENSDEIYHSGAGRIARLKMYPMSLFESNDSTGDVSLTEMLNGNVNCKYIGKVDLNKLANLIIRGGWPANMNTNEEDIGLIPKSYIESILNKDINENSEKQRDKNTMRMILKSLARNESALIGNKTILKDVLEYETEDDIVKSRTTINDYISVLNRLYLIENQEAFSTNYRSSKRVGKVAKRHLTDPSLSCAVLDLNKEKLLRDFNTFGLMFESLVARDLRIYMEYLDGKLYHFRDNTSGDEVDAIVEFPGGDYGAIEIKLTSEGIENAKTSLMRFYNNALNKPKFMCIIVGHYEAVIQDKETGIYIIPITSLRP